MNTEPMVPEPEPTKVICVLCDTEIATGTKIITTKSGKQSHLDCALVTANAAANMKGTGLRAKLRRERARALEKTLARAVKKEKL